MLTAFEDPEKAFDSMKWNKMFYILKRAGVTNKDKRLIKIVYKHEIGVVWCENSKVEPRIRKEVR